MRLGAAEEHHARAGGAHERELIEGEALAAGLDDPGARRLGEAQRAHLQGGHLEHARVIRHRADDGGDVPLAARHELGELGEGERGAVDLAHEQTLENGLVEVVLGRRATREEAVELHEKLQVHILRLGRRAVLNLVAPASLDVDPLRGEKEGRIRGKSRTVSRRVGGYAGDDGSEGGRRGWWSEEGGWARARRRRAAAVEHSSARTKTLKIAGAAVPVGVDAGGPPSARRERGGASAARRTDARAPGGALASLPGGRGRRRAERVRRRPYGVFFSDRGARALSHASGRARAAGPRGGMRR